MESVRDIVVRFLWFITVAYLVALTVFVAYEVSSLNQLGAILGTLVFTTVATLLASLAFSKDIQQSSQSQIEALYQISRGDREAAVEQGRLFRDSLARLEEARQVHETDPRRPVAPPSRRNAPEVILRIGERKTMVVFLPVSDYWLRVSSDVPLEELEVLARVRNPSRSTFGPWIRYHGVQIKPGVANGVINFGGIGVRGVYTEAEIHIEVVTNQGTRFMGEAVLPLAAGNSASVKLERA